MTEPTKEGGALPPTSAELKAEIETLKVKLAATVSKEEAAELRREIDLLKAELVEARKLEKEETKREDRAERPESWSDHFIH